jgi:hypothetical protein
VALYSIRLRRHPEVLPEGCTEVALIEKAGGKRNLGQRQACVSHEGQTVAQTAPHPIFSRRTAKYVAKRPGEIDRMYSELLRYLRDLQRVAASLVQEFARSSNPWRERSPVFVRPKGYS